MKDQFMLYFRHSFDEYEIDECINLINFPNVDRIFLINHLIINLKKLYNKSKKLNEIIYYILPKY